MMKALREVEYQFTKPFLVDASETEKTFGIVACEHTILWWRQRQPATLAA